MPNISGIVNNNLPEKIINEQVGRNGNQLDMMDPFYEIDLAATQLENSVSNLTESNSLDLVQRRMIKQRLYEAYKNAFHKLNNMTSYIKAEQVQISNDTTQMPMTSGDNNENAGNMREESYVTPKVKGFGLLNKEPSGKLIIEDILSRHSASLGYDFNLIQNQAREVNKIRMNSKDYANFAVGLMMHLFRKEEMSGRNVDGRLDRNKSQNIAKQALDEKRVGLINDLVQELTESSEPCKVWRYCRMKMNRKIINLSKN